jgi:hypothetical protein
MGAGRFFCVAIPFLLTLGSLICILIVMTAGVASKSIDMYSITPKALSLTLNDLKSISSDNNNLNVGSFGNANITAADLGLNNGYQVYLWNYCYQAAANNNTWCSKGAFNWAASALNTTALQANVSATAIKTIGQNITIPHSITDSLNAYITISRWIQIVYIIALVTTALELVVGLFGFCSRIASCLTYFVSALSSLAIIVASAGATAAAVVIVGALDSTVKKYGVSEAIDTRFLAVTWLAVLFSVGGGLFWLFSSCCCAADRPHRRGEEKGPYTPIHIVNNNGVGGPGPYGGAPAVQRTGGGYEPYRNV